MGRILVILQLSCCILGTLGGNASLHAQDLTDKKLQELANASRKRAEGTQVRVTADGRTTKAEVHLTPLMKYTDVPRQIEMATLWVWQQDGLPVALQKVEAYQRKEGTKWLYCFAAASTGIVEAKWPDGREFRARKVGLEWNPMKGPTPQETEAGRRRQLKDLFHRFSATTTVGDAKSDELRPLARPLHEYSSPKQGVAQGILCGFTANGTNPDVILALEAVGAAEGKGPPKSWRYGVIRMTTSGVSVKLDKEEVFTRTYVNTLKDRDEWTHFWEGEPKK